MQYNLCKNCEHTFEGKFCSNCGQKSSVGELKMHDLIHEFWHSVTHTDKGILKLIKDLFLHPKKVYLGYFQGERKTYFSPVTYFLIAAALLLLIGEKIFNYEDAVRLVNNPNGYNEYGRFVFEATKFKTLVTLPFEVLITWSLYRHKINFAKNIVFWIYFHALFFTIEILFTPLYFAFILQKQNIDLIVTVVGYTLLFWHLLVIFTTKKWYNYITVFVIVNLFHIINYTSSFTLLFGKDILVNTKSKNVFEFIAMLYKF